MHRDRTVHLMTFTFAGQYGPQTISNTSGAPLPNVAVNVYVVGTTTPVTLYTNRTKGTVGPNPVLTDASGNLTFFCAPGDVDIFGNGARLTVPVTPDSADIAALPGTTFTGAVILQGDPMTGLGAATKNYVDDTIGGGSAPPLTGDVTTAGAAATLVGTTNVENIIAANTAVAAALPKAYRITTQSGTTYTLALGDAATQIEFTNSAAVTVTIPLNATVAFPVGTFLNIRQMGTGLITVVGATGAVTIHSPGGLNTGSQYSTVSLVKDASDTWIFAGTGSGTPTTVPNAPVVTSAVAGAEQATVNWTAPTSNGGSAITAYGIVGYIGTTASALGSASATATSATLTGLIDGQAYTFRVFASNANGAGPNSALSNIVTPNGSVLTASDPNANTVAQNLLKLLKSMPSRSKVLTAQNMGGQYSNGTPYFIGYNFEIQPEFSGFTETDGPGPVTQVVPATNKYPSLINFDLSFALNNGAVGYAAQVPNNPGTTAGQSPRIPVSSWISNGVQNTAYAIPSTVPGIDGAVSQWQAGSLVSLTYHFDNPLTGGTFNDLGNQSGLAGSTTVNGATSAATIAGSGNFVLTNAALILFNGSAASAGIVSTPKTAATVAVTSPTAAGTDPVLLVTTATFHPAALTNIAVGDTVTGAGITGTVFVSAINTGTGVVTLAAWNSPSVTGSIGTLTASNYVFSGNVLVHFTGVATNTLTGCTIISGAGTIATTPNTVTAAGNGTMTSSFFSDPSSNAYTNFAGANNMLAQVANVCLAVQAVGGAVIYRPFHEPNGDWFWWCQGGGAPGGGTAAPWYAAAFRFIANYLQTAGVHNVLYAWGPNKNNATTTFGNADMTSYPGDAAVDVAGVDCYGEDPTNGWIQNCQAAIYTARSWTLATQKPYAVFEFGWVNPTAGWGTNGTGNATIYDNIAGPNFNPNGLWFKFDNADILTGFAASTPASSTAGPAYFMSWGQQWSIRWQKNFAPYLTSTHVATRSDVATYNWNS